MRQLKNYGNLDKVKLSKDPWVIARRQKGQKVTTWWCIHQIIPFKLSSINNNERGNKTRANRKYYRVFNNRRQALRCVVSRNDIPLSMLNWWTMPSIHSLCDSALYISLSCGLGGPLGVWMLSQTWRDNRSTVSLPDIPPFLISYIQRKLTLTV